MELDDSGFGLSIGALARATGIPANTLRTWERRYDFPRPKRTSGGHRLYDPADVEHLRLIARGLLRGHRPAQLLKLPCSGLRELIGRPAVEPVVHAKVGADTDWLDLVEALDGAALDQAFAGTWERVGAFAFVDAWAAPFSARLGDAWAAGRLQAFHERFAAKRLEAFLLNAWKAVSDRGCGPRVVLAALSSGRDEIPLHLRAVVLADAGRRVVYLGVDAPIGDVEQAVSGTCSSAVVIAVCPRADPPRVRSDLAALRDLLDEDVALAVAGPAAPTDVAGTTCLPGLPDLSRWAAEGL